MICQGLRWSLGLKDMVGHDACGSVFLYYHRNRTWQINREVCEVTISLTKQLILL